MQGIPRDNPFEMDHWVIVFRHPVRREKEEGGEEREGESPVN